MHQVGSYVFNHVHDGHKCVCRMLPGLAVAAAAASAAATHAPPHACHQAPPVAAAEG
jgi:hypothetical protein